MSIPAFARAMLTRAREALTNKPAPDRTNPPKVNGDPASVANQVLAARLPAEVSTALIDAKRGLTPKTVQAAIVEAKSIMVFCAAAQGLGGKPAAATAARFVAAGMHPDIARRVLQNELANASDEVEISTTHPEPRPRWPKARK